MHQKWSAFKITWVLYLGVFIVPLSFYYTFTQLSALKSSSQVVRELGSVGGEILSLTNDRNSSIAKEKIARIDDILKSQKSWIEHHNDDPYYVGSSSLMSDYQSLLECWSRFKENGNKKDAKECRRKALSLAFYADRIVMLTQDRIRNMLYVDLSIAVLLLLFLILFVREYIYTHLKQDFIRDEETQLFNLTYCRAVADNLCAQADRTKHPLSMIYIEVEIFNNKKLNRSYRADLLKRLGETFKDTTRRSDVVCRYSESSFLLLLPNTPEAESRLTAERVVNEIKERFGDGFEELKLKAWTDTRKEDEECHNFLYRSIDNIDTVVIN